MMLIYNEDTGDILAKIPKLHERYEDLFPGVLNLGTVDYDQSIEEWQSYRIIDNEFVQLTEKELGEKRVFGKVLSNEERLLNKLKPSYEEIKKAENTIDTLTLIQEVI